MGRRQADRGVAAGEDWLVITTTDSSGSTRDTVVAGVESGGKLYVSANHWPRGWYREAVDDPNVQITRAGERRTYRAVRIGDDERARVARDYRLPLMLRVLAGFPPRSFLRLDPR